MGWSCSAAASRTLDTISATCTAQTQQSNVFVSGGDRYFFETSRTEHADGAVTGEIFRYLRDGSGNVRECGTFRIEGNGDISQGMAGFKALAKTGKVLRQG